MEWEPGKWDMISKECGDIPLAEVMELFLLLDDKLLKSRVRLQEAWDEKSEMNRKLQVTYDEKAERGVQIQNLKAQVKGLKEQIKEMQVQEQECEKKWESFQGVSEPVTGATIVQMAKSADGYRRPVRGMSWTGMLKSTGKTMI